MSKFYVYCLVDPRTKTPFYVGKGCGKRAWSHTRKVKNGISLDNPHTENIIKRLLSEDVEPIIEIVSSDLEEVIAYYKEEELILLYGRKGFEPDGVLTNICLGGRPPSNLGGTRDHAGSKNPNFGKKHPGLNSGDANSMKGLYGKDNPNFGSRRSAHTKALMSSKRKGLSYEERYGLERANEIKERKRASMIHRSRK